MSQAPQTFGEYWQETVGGLTLEAAYEGSWGANLRASVDLDVSEDAAKSLGVTYAQGFSIHRPAPGRFPRSTTRPNTRVFSRSFRREPRI
jgi:hypothetical protein